MISKELLQKAAHANIIENHQVEPLMDFIQRHRHQQPDDTVGLSHREEPLKFIRNFGEVFITFGLVLFIVAISMMELSGHANIVPVFGFILIAEWLVRIRRLVLPGIAILMAILFFAFKTIGLDYENATSSGLGILCVTSLAFYLRYKISFSLLPLAAGLVAIGLLQIGANVIEHPIIFAGFGVLVFAVAICFDIRDTARITHLSDSAFWLHLLAAPLIVHGVMVTMLIGHQDWLQAIDKEVIIAMFFVGFLFIALLLDRRAILISTQLYMIYALTQIIQNQLNGTQNVVIYVLMVLGLFVILFGSFWYKTRRLVFGFLSQSAINHYVPDLNLTDTR